MIARALDRDTTGQVPCKGLQLDFVLWAATKKTRSDVHEQLALLT